MTSTKRQHDRISWDGWYFPYKESLSLDVISQKWPEALELFDWMCPDLAEISVRFIDADGELHVSAPRHLMLDSRHIHGV